MPFDFAEQIGALPAEQRLEFYEILAHELTISIRAFWSDEALSLDEKVERMKWVNEILHRVVAKVRVFRLSLHEWTEADFAQQIQGWVEQCPAIGQEVDWAIRHSYRSVTRPRADR